MYNVIINAIFLSIKKCEKKNLPWFPKKHYTAQPYSKLMIIIRNVS